MLGAGPPRCVVSVCVLALADAQLAEEILWTRLPSNAAVLESLERRRCKHQESLPEMRALLARLGHKPADLDALRVIHIAGSKGKGSTAAFVESVMRGHGLRTALFTSPHLVHPRERLRINGVSMGLVEFSAAVVRVYERLVGGGSEGVPGFFRFTTLLALDHMLRLAQAGALDLAVVEVGMGGRFDATNVIERPVVTAITSIAMEHVAALGPSLVDIAAHKAGIAKAGVPLLTVPQPAKVHAVLEQTAQQVGCPLVLVADPVGAVTLGIEGAHQRLNAALALNACHLWSAACRLPRPAGLDPSLVVRGLRSTAWPGRHHVHVETGAPGRVWYIDGAHTRESVEYAASWFEGHARRGRHRVLLFHCSRDRPFGPLLAPLLGLHAHLPFAQVFFVKPQSPTDSVGERACPDLLAHREMAAFWQAETGLACHSASAQSLADLLPVSAGEAQVLATGSLYLVGSVMQHLSIPIP